MTTMTADSLDGLHPIGLDELVARAELLTRVDRKYVLPVHEAEGLLEVVPPTTRILEIDGRRAFGYRSTYLDTPDRQSFFVAGRSHRRRWKVRTRAYLDTGGSWLEVKTRTSRDQNLKQRIEHPEADTIGGLDADGRVFVGAVIGPATTARLRPVLVTGYQRSTLLLPESESRVTIDVDLGWTSLASYQDLDRPSLAIVETKTGSTPSAVDRLLWRAGHRPLQISKYGVGMAALHPDLPRLKWHRTLHQHLGVDRAA